jgi:hypothetical protein
MATKRNATLEAMIEEATVHRRSSRLGRVGAESGFAGRRDCLGPVGKVQLGQDVRDVSMWDRIAAARPSWS